MCFFGGDTPPPPLPPPPGVDESALKRERQLQAERERKAKGRQSTVLTKRDETLGGTETGKGPNLLGN